MPAGLRELPPAQVGELGPGPLLSAACRERLEDGVLDALSTTLHSDQLVSTSVADRLPLLVNQEQDEGQAEDAHDAGACCQCSGRDIFAGGSVKGAVLKRSSAPLDLQLHEAMSYVQGMGLPVIPPCLHGVATVIPTVLQRQVHHHNVESPVVVRDELHTMVTSQ